MNRQVTVRASPSLALVKYWGKLPGGRNVPATTSIAVTLGGLDTTSTVEAGLPGLPDSVELAGIEQAPDRFSLFFREARKLFGFSESLNVNSNNSFPSSAGLASSSSGFAALALACSRFAGLSDGGPSLDTVSGLARIGSASAARAVFGGFTMLPAGSLSAEQLYDERWWPELRILVAVVTESAKAESSRSGMERARLSSPYHDAWVKNSELVASEALIALARKDLERLGELARLSTFRMHAQAMAADPPILYWIPATLAVIEACAALRSHGISAWETMDAGPQVKILCLKNELATIRAELIERLPGLRLIEARPGPAPDVNDAPENFPAKHAGTVQQNGTKP